MKKDPLSLLFAGLLLLVFGSMIFGGPGSKTVDPNAQVRIDPLDWSEFVHAVEGEDVDYVTILDSREIVGSYKDNGGYFTTRVPYDFGPTAFLMKHGIEIRAKEEIRDREIGTRLLFTLLGWLPMILLIGLSIKMMKSTTGGGIFGVTKTKAQVTMPGQGLVTFKDVAGIDEVRNDLEQVVDFLKNGQKYAEIGAKIPKGVLLVGPPGTGKTLTAKAVAGEAGVPFLSTSGSDFVEMFVGVGAGRVRDLFKKAKELAPCIVFIDEIDAMGRARSNGAGGNDEREQTLNQLLVEMDGFQAQTGIVIIAATNRPDVLDAALTRPGRFDRQLTVSLPDLKSREAILQVHLRGVQVDIGVDPLRIARGTSGFSGADLANLVNEAALMAVSRQRSTISMEDIELAKDKILMGAERRSLTMTDQEKRLTAYHEGGHALCGVLEEANGADPVHKATIIPRGRALGVVVTIPERDAISISHKQLLSRLVVLMAGRVAEEMIFGKENITTGASSDIQQATKLARDMVMKYGYSDRLGTIRYVQDEGNGFLGGSAGASAMSEETARAIDDEVRKIVDNAYRTAMELMTERRDRLEALAQALLERETLTGDEIREIIFPPAEPRPVAAE